MPAASDRGDRQQVGERRAKEGTEATVQPVLVCYDGNGYKRKGLRVTNGSVDYVVHLPLIGVIIRHHHVFSVK